MSTIQIILDEDRMDDPEYFKAKTSELIQSVFNRALVEGHQLYVQDIEIIRTAENQLALLGFLDGGNA